MRLLRAKVGGHFVLQNSGWFTIHPGCTSIAAPGGSGKSTLLRSLRSINPPSCDSNPAPFAEFPRFITTAGYRRKILPAKKTAVIAVFVCDDPLREKLAAIDPVYWQVDRIEVGRRLDYFRWITFIEIAASSRWSELDQEMVRLRELFREGKAAAELLNFFQENASLQGADRVKGALAEDLNTLLDRLIAHASSEQQNQHLLKVRRIVNRAKRYQEAVRVVENSIPVFVYLDHSCLLSGHISGGVKAENAGRQQTGCRHCPDLFLYEFLGIARLFQEQDDEGQISGQLKEQAAYLEEACKQLSARLSIYLPEIPITLSIKPANGGSEVQASIGGSPFASLAALGKPLRWMLSCAVCACYYSEPEKREIVFLLDEPDAALSQKEKSYLATFLLRLSASHQLLVATAAASPFPPKSGRQYRLKKEESGSIMVDLIEKNYSRK
ncbi:MAG: hypothetical protein P8130_08205 [Deltaproteobacteria bacterium]